MSRRAIVAALVLAALVLSGCPVKTSSAIPPLEVGKRYDFLLLENHGNYTSYMNEAGAVESVGSGNWVKLDTGSWVNLNLTSCIKPLPES
jgi:hypothetical protein